MCSGGQGNGRGDELTEAASVEDDGARWRCACAHAGLRTGLYTSGRSVVG
jgi:hypothetical protein